jgi:hypothetical protein
MPTIPDPELAKVARQRAEAAMGELFENPVRCVTRDGAKSRWHPVLQRHIYASDSEVYHTINTVKVAVHRDGRVIGFRDETRFEIKGDPPFDPIPDADLDAIARTTGVIAGDAKLTDVSEEEGGLLELNYEQRGRGVPEQIRMIINVSTRQVAAFVTDPAAAGMV